MPSLQEAIQTNREGYVRVDRDLQHPNIDASLGGDLEPRFNPFVRSPLPPIAVGSDTLRQFYIKGQVPQFRILTAADGQSAVGSGGTIINNITTTTSGGTTVTTVGNSGSVSVTTPVLNPGQYFTTTVITPKTFDVLSVTSGNPARIEMYGNSTAQSSDLSRGIDVAPPPGTIQGLVFDIVLDTSPYQWFFQNVVASNSSSPQATLMYLTITNVDVSSNPITVTINYIIAES